MRKALLAGVALGCLLCADTASAGLLSNIVKSATSTTSSVVSTVLPGSNGFVLDAPADPNNPKVHPFYGNINPFYGNINPFYGNINPFYGNISPFWGNISPFWGSINPFYGSISPFYGNISPFWGSINPFDASIGPFWQSAGPQWGAINTLWNDLQASNATDYSGLQAQLKGFIASSSDFWSAAVHKYTGKDFNSGFADAVLSTYGIDPDDASSLANVSPMVRSAFMLSWYDGLMNFTGVDHVDWWMSSVDWSPALTKIQNANGDVIVGVLDSTFDGDATGVDNVHFAGGYKVYVNQHGGAVASLIAAQQDGQGVMGIAPNSQIELYNPFDQTGTTNWQDVTTGIDTLYKRGATVVNASLGTPGWTLSPEWISILSGSLLSSRKNNLLIVKAAGNEGVAQSQNIEWLSNLSNLSLAALTPIDNLIMVGSIGPTGEISSFSNTPGNACVTVAGICMPQNKLMYHFVVAPGELILVADGHGGVTRMSGTSFAAPLVTGAIALLQDRWPWLAQHAPETAQIIFRSAKDLGAPGVDPVYGWGELDVQASQAPLNFDNLLVYQPFAYNGSALNPLQTLLPNWSARSLKQSVLNPGQLDLWQNKNAYLVAIEPIGTTYRDFTIPLSTMLVGKNQKTSYGNNPFQSYLYQRLIDWARGSNFSNFSSQSVMLGHSAWDLNLTTTAPLPEEERETGIARPHYEMRLSNASDGVDFRVGEGNGAHGLMSELTSGSEQVGIFSLATDFDPSTGGVNPVLGLASGGAYAQGGMSFGGLHFSAGYSEKTDDHIYTDATFGPMRSVPLPTNKAAASVFGLDYALTGNFTFNASYTSLNEYDGFLGAQGGGVLSFGNGARTNAATVGGTANFDGGWGFAASATLGNTTPGSTNSALSFTTTTMRSTAYEFVGKKTGVFGEKDELRVSFTQPLHVENGGLQYRSIEVVGRSTGALGPVTQTWNIAGPREHRIEAIYAVPVLNDRVQLAGFGLVDMNAAETNGRSTALSAGLQIQIGY
ncbi:MAG: S8 family peptidase [Rhizomicrobium sp.]